MIIPNIWENKTCSKAPTTLDIWSCFSFLFKVGLHELGCVLSPPGFDFGQIQRFDSQSYLWSKSDKRHIIFRSILINQSTPNLLCSLPVSHTFMLFKQQSTTQTRQCMNLWILWSNLGNGGSDFLTFT